MATHAIYAVKHHIMMNSLRSTKLKCVMALDQCFDYVSENKVLENVTDSSKLSRKGQNALKNEPIAVEDNSSMANSENMIALYLIHNQLFSVYNLADFIKERMQLSYANTGLALALRFSSKYVGMTLIFTHPSLDTLLYLKTWDLGTKIYKGGDAHNRFKWLKQFIPMESGALLCTCSLSDLIKLIIGYRGHDSLISEVEGELKLLAKESKGADDLDVALRVLEIIRNILVKRLYGSRVTSLQNKSQNLVNPGEIISNCFTNQRSAKQRIPRNGNGLAQSWRRYADQSMLKVAGRLQKDEEKRKNTEKIKIAGRLQKDEEKRKNIEKIKIAGRLQKDEEKRKNIDKIKIAGRLQKDEEKRKNIDKIKIAGRLQKDEEKRKNIDKIKIAGRLRYVNYVNRFKSISINEKMYLIKWSNVMIFTQNKKGFLHCYPDFPIEAAV